MVQVPQPQVVAVTFSRSGSNEPPRAANYVATSFMNEMTIVSFGYVDPLKQLPPAAVIGQPISVEAPIFAQVAVPRSVYAQSLRESLAIIKQLPDRDTFLWNE